MKKAQASIEYLFALVIFLFIVITSYQLFYVSNQKILDLKKRFEAEIFSEQIMSSLFLVSNLRQNLSITIESNIENINYLQISSGEIFLYDEENLENIFLTTSLNITPLSKTKIKKMVINYYGGNISFS